MKINRYLYNRYIELRYLVPTHLYPLSYNFSKLQKHLYYPNIKGIHCHLICVNDLIPILIQSNCIA